MKRQRFQLRDRIFAAEVDEVIRALVFLGLLSGGCREPNVVNTQAKGVVASRAEPSITTAPVVASDAARPADDQPAPAAIPQSAPAQPVKKGSECASNRDCELVSDGCCGCSSGGKHKVIPKSQRAAYDRQQRARCGEIVECVQVISSDPSCLMDPACQAGRCVLVPRQP